MDTLGRLLIKVTSTLAIASVVAVPVRAEFRAGPLTFSAFGTLGGVWSSNNQADYTIGIQPSGPGRSYDFDLGMDSRLGGQLDLGLTESTTLTAQAVVDRNARNQFIPRLTLGHVRQQFLDYFTVRAGRMQNPMFLAAEYRLANFSNPWVRTPNVVYDLYPLVYYDGADLSFRYGTPLGQLTLRSGYGWFDFEVPVQGRDRYFLGKGQLRNLYFFSTQLEQGPWRVKAGWIQGQTDYHDPLMDQGLGYLGMFDGAAARRLLLRDKTGSLISLGAAYDGADWLVMGEWVYTFSNGGLTNRHGGYLTVGYHWERFMPQLTIGYVSSLAPDTRSANPIAQGILDQMYRGSNQDQSLLALGLNYYVNDSVAVRGQVDLIQPHRNSNGPYTMNQTFKYRIDRPDLECLVSLSVDFVY